MMIHPALCSPGWRQDPEGTWWYMDGSGHMLTGWQKESEAPGIS
ncbi:MAG: hypothetical protein ACLRT5_12140 [Lachnospiraceae bacterium]